MMLTLFSTSKGREKEYVGQGVSGGTTHGNSYTPGIHKELRKWKLKVAFSKDKTNVDYCLPLEFVQ